jgi:hypothetical protein
MRCGASRLLRGRRLVMRNPRATGTRPQQSDEAVLAKGGERE